MKTRERKGDAPRGDRVLPGSPGRSCGRKLPAPCGLGLPGAPCVGRGALLSLRPWGPQLEAVNRVLGLRFS